MQTRNPKADVAVVRLDRVKHATLRNSVAWPGTGVFLSVRAGFASSGEVDRERSQRRGCARKDGRSGLLEIDQYAR